MSAIFLSYCWANRDIADIIDQAFQPTGVTLQRDVRSLEYKDSIKGYMQKIRETDFALLLISDQFLKSSNCMYEVLEVLKEKDFKDKILPVYIAGTKIFKPVDKIEYINYWKKQYDELNESLKEVEVTAAIDLYRDLRHVKNIHDSIGEFFSVVSDMNLMSSTDLINNKFKPIFDHIGVSDKILIDRILSLRDVRDKEDRDIALDQLEFDYPNNARVLFAKGSYSYNGKEQKKAVYYYRKAIEFDPNFAPSYYNLGYQIDTYGNNPKEAAEFYTKAIELDSGNTRAMNNLARIYSVDLNEFLKARNLYERALELVPEDATCLHNLAVLLYQKFDEGDLAAVLFQRSIEIEPNSDSLFGLGLLQWKHFSQVKEALGNFKAALGLDPENKKIIKSIGNIYDRELSEPALAKNYFDKVMELEPSAAEHNMYYVFLLQKAFGDKYRSLAAKHYQIAAKLDSLYRAEVMDQYLKVKW